MEEALRLLSIARDTANVRDAFIHRLRVLTLFLIRLSEEERENLFRSLILLYSNSCHGSFAEDVLASIAADYNAGLRERLRSRLDNAFKILQKMRDRDAPFTEQYMALLEGYRLLDRYAYLAYLWSLFRFNRLALHTVVRLASITISGVLGTLLTITAGFVLLLLIQVFTAPDIRWLSQYILITQALGIFVFAITAIILVSAIGRFVSLARAFARRKGVAKRTR